VITSATEDYAIGSIETGGEAVGADSFIIVAGGNTMKAPFAYGMNSWTMTA